MHVRLPDGTLLEIGDGATGHDAAAAIGPGLAKAAVAIVVGGEMRDLARPLAEGDSIEIITKKSGEHYLYPMRHTAAHVLAEAVQTCVGGEVKFGFGPPIDDGFYYDFELPRPLTDDDFPAIEAEIQRISKTSAPMQRSVMTVDDARAHFAAAGQSYKVDQVDELAGKGETHVSLYRQRDFTDLCQGPHVADTGKIGAVKLLSVAGAYWRGSEKNPMLTRIYATSFPSKADLEAHLDRLEQARARDHRKVGRELELFHFDDAGPGMPFFLPKGMVVINEIQRHLREELAGMGYDEVRTPTILSDHLWHESGHYENYKDNMYFTEVDGHGFAVKPMNCPGACLVFRSRRRSYRDLPVRLAEFGHVHRHELSGVLHGLLRVRAFTQDDAHVFCRFDQVQSEIGDILDLVDRLYPRFGFDNVRLYLSTRPEKGAGTPEMWDRAEAQLRLALGDRAYETKDGDGAFYGPKIDVQITDVIGRAWQLGTVQLDFFLPERFDLHFVNSDDVEERPVIIHRAILGSLERFLGILIENCGGDFPFWVAPVQARVLPVSDRHAPFAEGVRDVLGSRGIRVELDGRGESVGKRIRDSELAKVPYLFVVGDKETETGVLTPRVRGDHDATPAEIDLIAERLAAEAARR